MSLLKKAAGFTLLEMAIVFSLIGLFFVFVISFMKPYYAEKVSSKNVAALQTVEDALSRYVAKYNRYPCPASPSAARGTADDGLALLCTATKGIVSADGARDPASKVLIGAVPYRELNISADSTVDGYFNRLTYAVTVASTNAYNDTDAGLSGQIRILSADDPANKTSLTRIAGGAHYFVFSRGQNGAGAYSEGGALRSGACPANEAENCNNDSTFVSARLAQATGNRYFDDLSKFNLDTEMTDQQNSQDESTEPTQWWQLTDPAVKDGDITNVNGENVIVHKMTPYNKLANAPNMGIDRKTLNTPSISVGGEIKIGSTEFECIGNMYTAAYGMLRYNKQKKVMEVCNGNKWVAVIEENSCEGRIKNIQTAPPVNVNYKGAPQQMAANSNDAPSSKMPAGVVDLRSHDKTTCTKAIGGAGDLDCYFATPVLELPSDDRTCYLKIDRSVSSLGNAGRTRMIIVAYYTYTPAHSSTSYGTGSVVIFDSHHGGVDNRDVTPFFRSDVNSGFGPTTSNFKSTPVFVRSMLLNPLYGYGAVYPNMSAGWPYNSGVTAYMRQSAPRPSNIFADGIYQNQGRMLTQYIKLPSKLLQDLRLNRNSYKGLTNLKNIYIRGFIQPQYLSDYEKFAELATGGPEPEVDMHLTITPME